jgi:hypothetical protein
MNSTQAGKDIQRDRSRRDPDERDERDERDGAREEKRDMSILQSS